MATFTKLQVLDPNLSTSIIGKAIADVSNLDWVRNWSNVGFVKLVDFNGDGILQINEFFLRGKSEVLKYLTNAGFTELRVGGFRRGVARGHSLAPQ